MVFGLGKSGQATAERLLASGVKVTVTDSKSAAELKPLVEQLTESAQKISQQIVFELGGHPAKLLSKTDFIVLSPGVPADLPVLEAAKKKGIPLIGEMELASVFFPGLPFLAVTGTNGKTTTTDLLGRLLNEAGKKAAVAGNIGTPLMAIKENDLDAVVVEVSSYQSEVATFFRPKIALFLNLTPDHLGRHKTMAGYGLAKARLWQKQTPEDFLIYNADDPWAAKLVTSARSKAIPFSVKHQVPGGVYCDDHDFYSTLDSDQPRLLFPVALLNLVGRHNYANVAAAVAAALVFRVPLESIKKTLADYKAPEHRIELVRVKDGIIFVNDSKATNPDSVLVALDALPYPPELLAKAGLANGQGQPKNTGIVLILGGRDKNTPLEAMVAKIKDKVRQVVLLGEAADRFAKALAEGGYKNWQRAASFKEAVALAYRLAQPGETVLLSPACASFDLFDNFEERGRVFKELVGRL